MHSPSQHSEKICISSELIVPEPFFACSTIIGSNNIEICARTLSDNTFQRVMSRIPVQLADGRGFQWLLWLLTGRKVRKQSGSDVYLRLVGRCAELRRAVVIYGGSAAANRAAVLELGRMFPGVHVVGDSPPMGLTLRQNTRRLLRLLAREDVGVCLVCLGAPKQEYVAYLCAKQLDTQTAFLCAGGTVDFIARALPRAPKVLQYVGLEWAFRLVLQPRRSARLLQAVTTLVRHIRAFPAVYR